MDLSKLIKQYLPSKNVMQLATSANNQPWVCTVHYYSDDKLNLYWISTPERRHSQEIRDNPKVAATIMVHENTSEEAYVIGISVEGTAELLDDIDDEIVLAYVSKQSKSPNLMDDIRAGRNPHRFYKLTPNKIVLFDSKNLGDNPRQELSLK